MIGETCSKSVPIRRRFKLRTIVKTWFKRSNNILCVVAARLQNLWRISLSLCQGRRRQSQRQRAQLWKLYITWVADFHTFKDCHRYAFNLYFHFIKRFILARARNINYMQRPRLPAPAPGSAYEYDSCVARRRQTTPHLTNLRNYCPYLEMVAVRVGPSPSIRKGNCCT